MDNYSDRFASLEVFTMDVSSLTSSSLSEPIDSYLCVSMYSPW
jgi:hypothetical protein